MRAFQKCVVAAAITTCLLTGAALADDGCDNLKNLKEAGAKGVDGAQATVAIIYAFDIDICHTVVPDDPYNVVRADAWLTDNAVASIANMPPEQKAEILRQLTETPQVLDPGIQDVLDEMYAERKSLLSLDHLRSWLRSRMTMKQIEDARTLRRVLNLK